MVLLALISTTCQIALFLSGGQCLKDDSNKVIIHANAEVSSLPITCTYSLPLLHKTLNEKTTFFLL
jgi:hypothetical protein